MVLGKTLLLVDDEENILKALQQIFLPLGHRVLTADSGEKGLALLSEEPVDLVISDIYMPGMNGHQFLKQVRSLYPATMRAILGGFSEDRDVMGCLRDGSARMYILKPWDKDMLVEEIEKLLQLGEMFSRRQLLEVFNNLKDLPTMPDLYRRLCAMIEKNASLEEIAHIVEHDQTVAVKLLQVTNSVYYNMSTGSVRQAIVYMGLTNLKTIVLGLTVMKQMDGLHGGFFSKDVLWEHADRVNQLTRQLFEHFLGRQMKENEATAGLLHDIGRILLIKDYSQPYFSVYRSVFQNRDTTFRDTERSLMGISHDEVGGFLLNWWSLPHPIVEAAMFHHDPLNPAIINKEVVAAVHIADYFAWKQKKSLTLPKMQSGAFAALGTTPEVCEAFLMDIREGC
jgi:HD-like signal output (HDOD) protein/CheY-like chemotaxis protein